MMAASCNNRSFCAIALTCLAYFLFNLNDVFYKILGQDYTYPQILAFLHLMAVISMGVWVLWQKGPAGFKTRHLKSHVIRGIVATVSGWLIVAALVHIALVDFYVIIFLAPLTVTLLAYFFLGENPGWRIMTAIAAGFGGVLVLALPQLSALNIGFLYVFLGMIGFSLSILLLRFVGDGEFTPLYLFYPSLCVFLINGLLLLFIDVRWPDFSDLWLFVGLAICGVSGQLVFALGKTRAPTAATVMPFHYTQIIWGALLGYAVFHDIPEWPTIAGACLVISSGLYVIYLQAGAKKAKAPSVS